MIETETNRFADPDQAYRAVATAIRGMSAEDAAAFNARLVLILANQIGDVALIQEAIDLAQRTGEPQKA